MLKKFILLVFAIFLLASCSNNNQPTDSTTTTTTQKQESTITANPVSTTKAIETSEIKKEATTQKQNTAESTTKKQDNKTTTAKKDLPEYVPGSIKLLDNDYYGHGVYRPYRLVYFQIPIEIIALSEAEDVDSWMQDNFFGYFNKMNDKMPIVEFVKHYNIPKDKFDNVVAQLLQLPDANKNEEYEVPNSDIIYTFDYEIINRYYRYE